MYQAIAAASIAAGARVRGERIDRLRQDEREALQMVDHESVSGRRAAVTTSAVLLPQ